MSNTKINDEQREKVLNITFELNPEGEIFGRYSFVPRFLSNLKKNDSHRECFIAELVERLNGYIDGASDE
jgi:hypothetical protein